MVKETCNYAPSYLRLAVTGKSNFVLTTLHFCKNALDKLRLHQNLYLRIFISKPVE